MQFEVTPETERLIACPNCHLVLSIHVFDDRIVCPRCFMAYDRDYKTGKMEFAFESFAGDFAEKYTRDPATCGDIELEFQKSGDVVSCTPYVSYDTTFPKSITLDGDFAVDDLERLVKIVSAIQQSLSESAKDELDEH